MIAGLDHVHIMCGDAEKSVKYFQDVFGGKVESRGELRGFPMIRMDVQGVFINLMGTDAKAGMLEPGKGSRGMDHFGFKVKELEKTVDDLKKKGAKISAGPGVTATGVKFAFVDGPDGIRIELVERPQTSPQKT